MHYSTISAPIGDLTLVSEGDAAIVGLYFANHRGGSSAVDTAWTEDGGVPILQEATKQLDEYFAGTRTTFDLPLRPIGTAFQLVVWEQLRQIPFGETISYGELARRVGNPAASRAVGMANGRNPISIIVPCHRVIGADGSLTGFGGGVDVKRKLLELEGAKMGSTLFANV
jgi:methylated-DNA-[protein]-cysteine S-methyltransferase